MEFRAAALFAKAHDNVVWFPIGSAVTTSTASTVLTPVVETGVYARYVRARVASAITGGGTITATIGVSG